MSKFYSILFISLISQFIFAQELEFKSGDKQTILLELYTSEGCSSCPPADRWLSQLKNKTQLWQDIVPLAFHVDYWDDLGWDDEYAQSDFSKRQRNHRYYGNISSVYTPGVVKNGKEFRHWYYGFNLGDSRPVVGALSTKLKDGQLTIDFDNLTKQKSLVLNVALLGVDIVSDVDAGENEGRTLAHDFVVLNHRTYPQSPLQNNPKWIVPLPTSHIKSPRYALAVWISKTSNQQPVQASGAWLAKVKK